MWSGSVELKVGNNSKKSPPPKAKDMVDVKWEIKRERGKARSFAVGNKGSDCAARMRANCRDLSNRGTFE